MTDQYKFYHIFTIFEKIIYNYIIEFMEENKLFDCNQFGFCKQYSTSHAIITLVEIVSRALDTGKMVVGVFLDFKKVFDTVDHKILLRKLQLYEEIYMLGCTVI